MTAMTDWVTVKVRCGGSADVHACFLAHYDREGVGRWLSRARHKVPGAAGATIAVRCISENMLDISGNLSRLLQGHNLSGPADLCTLVTRTMGRLVATLGLALSAADRAGWASGNFTVSRIDLARTYDLDTPGCVRHVATILGREIAPGRQTISAYGAEAVYRGEQSRRVTVLFYDKASALAAPGGALPAGLSARRREALLSWARGKLRVEVRLKQRELSRRTPRRGAAWTPALVERPIDQQIGRLILPSAALLADAERAALDRKSAAIYELWLAGHDLRALYSPSPVSRYSHLFLPRGIDIARSRPLPPVGPLGIAVPLADLFAGPGASPPPGIARWAARGRGGMHTRRDRRYRRIASRLVGPRARADVSLPAIRRRGRDRASGRGAAGRRRGGTTRPNTLGARRTERNEAEASPATTPQPGDQADEGRVFETGMLPTRPGTSGAPRQ